MDETYNVSLVIGFVVVEHDLLRCHRCGMYIDSIRNSKHTNLMNDQFPHLRTTNKIYHDTLASVESP